MNNISILNEQGEELNMELVLAFTCDENNKTYVALNNKDEIFEKNSRYANIDIFEIVKEKSRYIYVTDISSEEWELVKHSLQYKVFAKLNN